MKNILLVNIIIIVAASIYINEFILTGEYYHNALGSQLSYDQVESMMQEMKRMVWIDYIIAILSYLLQIFVISAVVYLVIILNEKKASYADIAYIVSESFTIFLFPILIKVFFFSFSTSSISPDDLRYFSFGSVLNFFDMDSIENWLKVILKSINIWEAIFMGLLAIQLKKYFDNDFKKAMGSIPRSYI